MDFLPTGYLRFITLLEKHEVRYFLIGGFAVNVHGYARTTEDLDILFESDSGNGRKLLAAIGEFGFDTSEFADYDFSQPVHLRIGEFPNSIDLINQTLGIDFKKAYERSNPLQLGEINTRVIHINDLIANKTALNTYKDLADAEALKKIQRHL